MHFISPISLDNISSTDLDKDYPYWLGGSINWVVQTFLVLRQYREDVTISTKPVPRKINIAHVQTWRSLPSQRVEYCVSIRADYRRLFDVDFEILQNPTAICSSKQAYLTYWPIPGIRPRAHNRKTVTNIAYAGRLGNRNIDVSLQDSISKLNGLNFKLVEKNKWHDMHDIDVLVAVRDFSLSTYNEKPPSKLLNAWHAGIPLIAGYDSAFSSIGNPGKDYIRVKTKSELLSALEKLRSDPIFYREIVDAGRMRAKEYTREKIAKTWLELLDNRIIPDFELKKNDSDKKYSLKRVADIVSDSISYVKHSLAKN